MTTSVIRLDDTLKGYVFTVQEFAQLCATAFAGAFRRPWYLRDTLYHMDTIGVGSLFIVVLTGIFTGMVLALQGAIQLEPYGAVQYISRLISTSVVRELGPVLAALMIDGRVGSGMASELASMQVTEQIDARRAEGTDPIKKLVTPRLVASLIMVPVLTVNTDVCVKFDGRPVLKNFTMEVPTGETLVILGGSGGGKPTMLRLTLGLLRPDSGSILVDGQEIVGLPERDMVPIRARMAMVFQGSALFDSLSVRENVGYRLYEEGALSDYAIERLVVLSLCFVGLEDTLEKMPAELSGGMKK